MTDRANTTVRMFGALHTVRRDRGLEPTAEVALPPEGRTGLDLARDLDLPLEKIEGIFINHVAGPLESLVRPGDRVAFIPRGVPGPHRFLLGIFEAGKKSEASRD